MDEFGLRMEALVVATAPFFLFVGMFLGMGFAKCEDVVPAGIE
jgi:hypothetical protein